MKRETRLAVILPLLLLVLTLGGMTVKASAAGPAEGQITVQKNDSDTVQNYTNSESDQPALLNALAAGNATVRIGPNTIFKIKTDTETSKRMKPALIGGGIRIVGSGGSSLVSWSPLQLTGDGVRVENLGLELVSSDALNATPHREIFLAGHSLTLDGVTTWRESYGGDLGNLGGTQQRLLPTVFAGGYPNAELPVGSHAQLTVVNAVENYTVFQDIFLAHSGHGGQFTTYTGKATLTLGPNVEVEDGLKEDHTVFSAIRAVDRAGGMPTESTDATVIFRGTGQGSKSGGCWLEANEHTTVKLESISLDSQTVLKNVGRLEVDAASQMTVGSMSQLAVPPSMAVNDPMTVGELTLLGMISLQDKGTLEVTGDFAGGGTLFFGDGTDNHFTCGGAVAGSTKISSTMWMVGESPVTTTGTAGTGSFVLLDNQGDKRLRKIGTEWEVEFIPQDAVTKITVSRKELEVDLARMDYPQTMQIYFYSGDHLLSPGEVSNDPVLMDGEVLQSVVAIRKDYWEMTPKQAAEHDLDERNLWGGNIRLLLEYGDSYSLSVPPDQKPGEYVLLFLDVLTVNAEEKTPYGEIYDAIRQESVVLATVPLHITDSSAPQNPELTLTAAERTETGVALTCGLPAVPEKGSGVLMAVGYSDKGQLIALTQQAVSLTQPGAQPLTLQGKDICRVAVFLTDGKSWTPLTGKAEQTLQTVP